MGLDIRMFGTKKRLRAADGERFGDVDELASPVIPLAGIAFGVFVGQDRSPPRSRIAESSRSFLTQSVRTARCRARGLVANGVSDFGIEIGKCAHDGP